MRLALVFNPFSYKLHEENLRIVQKYFGLFPPLSLCWVAAIAKRAGHDVLLVDARTLRLSKPDVADILKKFKPDAMGFMMTTYMFRETLGWAEYLKRRFPVPVIVGGYNLFIYPKESVMPDVVDFGCADHALYTVPELLAALERGDKDFSKIPGLVYKVDGEVRLNPPVPVNFNDFPFPDRSQLPNELYAEFPTARKNFTVMVTSLGCPKGCVFCEVSRTRYNARSAELVVAEMRECYERYDIREIDIFDYEFCFLNDRVREICDGILSAGLDIRWACRARVDTVDYELLKVMKRAGCDRIYFGIEADDQRTLDELNKGVSVEQAVETVKNCRRLGIKALGFFLIGVPGETRERVIRRVRFARRLKLDYAQFSKLTAKPGTGLWKELVERTGRDYWRDYILGLTEERELERPWTGVDNAKIDEWTKMAYLRFYLWPPFLVRSVFRVRMLSEFVRKALALFDMIFSQERRSRPDPNFRAYSENPPFKIKRARARLVKLVESLGSGE